MGISSGGPSAQSVGGLEGRASKLAGLMPSKKTSDSFKTTSTTTNGRPTNRPSASVRLGKSVGRQRRHCSGGGAGAAVASVSRKLVKPLASAVGVIDVVRLG